MNDEDRMAITEDFSYLFLALEVLYSNSPSPKDMAQALEEISEMLPRLSLLKKRDYYDAFKQEIPH